MSRLHHRFGREMSQRSRMVATWIIIFVAVACVIALALGWIAALSAA